MIVDRGVGRGIRGRYRSESEASGEEESHSPINVRKRKGSTGPQGVQNGGKATCPRRTNFCRRSALGTLKSTFSDTSTKNGKTC